MNMGKFFQKWMVVVLAICLVTALGFTTALAGPRKTTTASIKVSFDFSKEENANMKQWMKSAVDQGKKKLEKRLIEEQDGIQKQHLQNDIDLMDKTSPTDMFRDHADGSTSIVTGVPFVDVKIGDHDVVTDENSQFTISGLEKGEYPITLAYKGREFFKSTVKIENLNQENIVLNIPGSSIWKAADKMQQSMTESQKVKAQNIYFQTYQDETMVPWAVSPGPMKVKQNDNYVGCNKADNWSSDYSYETSSFPNNNSDCALSIVYGIWYAYNPSYYYNYYMSYYCFLEGIGQRLGEGSNPYCNGEWKSGHINCSWFYGIWCAERLHAHN